MAIDSYFNQKGEEVVIAEMPDAYLLNSLVFYKKRRQELIERRHQVGFQVAAGYLKEINELVEALRAEVNKRGLV